jgi:hypothetical protein
MQAKVKGSTPGIAGLEEILAQFLPSGKIP